MKTDTEKTPSIDWIKPRHWANHYQIMVSTSGTADKDFTLIEERDRSTGDWEEFLIEPVEAKYIKLVLLEPQGDWKVMGEFEVFTPKSSSEKYYISSKLTEVTEVDLMAPNSFRLEQNHPNPFNPLTSIQFDIPESANIIFSVYNVAGQKVRTLLNEAKEAGTHQIIWDAKDDLGVKVSSGVYFYIIKVISNDREFIQTKKMTLIR